MQKTINYFSVYLKLKSETKSHLVLLISKRMARLWVVLVLVMLVLVLVFLLAALTFHLVVISHLLFSLTTSSQMGLFLLSELARPNIILI